jgi:hypothetical protein
MGIIYQCEKCEYQATRKSGLTTHHHSLHIHKTNSCEQCDYQATDKADLTQHYQSVHKGKYGCEQRKFKATSYYYDISQCIWG